MSEVKIDAGQLKKLTVAELSLFSYQLSLVLRSGMPYLEGIQLFSEEIAHPKLKQIAIRLYNDVKEGKKLHEAFENMALFPEYYVQMTKIAETTGTIDVEMERLSAFYDKSDKLNYKIRNALTYPLVLVVLMTGVIMLLILKVFPVFQEVLASLGGEIPAATAFLFDVSAGIQNYGTWILGILAVLILVFMVYVRTAKGSLDYDRMKLNAPYVKELNRKIMASKLSQSLALLIRSGIPLEEALVLVAPTLGNQYAKDQIMKAQADLIQGKNMIEVFETIDVLPKLFIKMLNVGHKTGELDKMLAKLNDIYEVEVDRFLQNTTSAIEPTLVIILSLVVGAILLTVMLPLISIMASIG